MTGLLSSSFSCGACKFLRRKCSIDCVFAPYFSYENSASHFAAVHKVFGASNASKLLSHLPIHSRREAAATVSYEALARVNDPIYGCVAHIIMLQQQVASLQEEIHSLLVTQMDSRRHTVAAIENIWCSESDRLNYHQSLNHDGLLHAVSPHGFNSLAYNNNNNNNNNNALLIHHQQNPQEGPRNASVEDAILYDQLIDYDQLPNIDFMWDDDTIEIQNQFECLLGIMEKEEEEEEESCAMNMWIDHNLSTINNLGW